MKFKLQVHNYGPINIDFILFHLNETYFLKNLLPVKWTAIEALVEGKFTSASDV
jgi:hypothetical protein